MAQPRPLGRGLEQLSRAFLTQESPEQVESPRPEAAAAAPLLLLPPAQATRQRIVAALKGRAGGLEEGFRVLDEALPCEPCGQIDLLAVDGANRLAVVDLETAAADELLLRGLGHVDWMIGNVPLLRRLYRGTPINFSLPPRLILLAPAFSARIRYAARQVASPEIEWIRYHLVETPAGAGIFLERLPVE